jgi:hypothetical protein
VRGPASCQAELEPLYNHRIDTLRALEDFDKSSETDRDAALELLKLSVNCKPEVVRGRFEAGTSISRSDSTKDRLVIFTKSASVWTAGSAAGDDQRGENYTAEEEISAEFKDLMLALHEPDGRLSLICLSGKCIKETKNGEQQLTRKALLPSCGGNAAANARNAFNYLVLFARD